MIVPSSRFSKTEFHPETSVTDVSKKEDIDFLEEMGIPTCGQINKLLQLLYSIIT